MKLAKIKTILDGYVGEKIMIGTFNSIAFPSIEKATLMECKIMPYAQYEESLLIGFKAGRKTYRTRVNPGEMLIIWDGWHDEIEVGDTFCSLDELLFRDLCKKVKPIIRQHLEEKDDGILKVGTKLISKYGSVDYRVTGYNPGGKVTQNGISMQVPATYDLISEDGESKENISLSLVDSWTVLRENIADETELEDLKEKNTKAVARRQQDRKDENARLAEVKKKGEALYDSIVPAWAEAIIVASYETDKSDPMTDYFHVSSDSDILIGFSKHKRNLFSELRKACKSSGLKQLEEFIVAPTVDINGDKKSEINKSWWHPADEHREGYSGGGGYYLKGARRYGDGWAVSKRAIYKDWLVMMLGRGDYSLAEKEVVVARDVRVVDYSEKAVAVFGDTKPIKDELKKIGGRFNGRLTNPITKEKQAGWIFPKKKKEEIEKIIGG